MILLLLACTPLSMDFAESLTHVNGCADIKMYASNAGSTVAMFFESEGLVAAACEGDTTWSWDLPEASVSLYVQQGSRLTSQSCTDVYVSGEEPVVGRTWTATSGHASLDIVPGSDPDTCPEANADATLELTEVTFTADDSGEEVAVEAFTMETTVGWLPG